MSRIKSDDDDDKILKDGESLRVSMTMRDSLSPLQRSVADATSRVTNRITDGRTDDPLALNRPGFRVPVVNDRRAVRDAYQHYETSVTNAYRVGDGTQCPECFGSGEDEDGECSACEGTGIMPERSSGTSKGGKGFGSRNEGGYDNDEPDPASDSRQAMDQHRQTMDRLYRERDAELANAWRGRR
jgi:hypothetical protein